ncbi:MAG: hypothetical protein HQK77_21660 [Desulfobacterales bacterium]|nr:hypothetical protein [Desulfobacterales bacterium]
MTQNDFNKIKHDLFAILPKAFQERAYNLFLSPQFLKAELYKKKHRQDWFISEIAEVFLVINEYQIAEALYSHLVSIDKDDYYDLDAGLAVCIYNKGIFSHSLRHMQNSIKKYISFELSHFENPNDLPFYHWSIPVKGYLSFGNKVIIGDARLSLFDHLSESEFPTNDQEYANIIMTEAFYRYAKIWFAMRDVIQKYEIASTCLKMLHRIFPDDHELKSFLETCLAESAEFKKLFSVEQDH